MNKGRYRKKMASGRAKGETDAERDFRPEQVDSYVIREMMNDPYWAFRFMHNNGVSRIGG